MFGVRPGAVLHLCGAVAAPSVFSGVSCVLSVFSHTVVLWVSSIFALRFACPRPLPQARKLRAAVDPGISWPGILRFSDISFSEGGEFKLCFCDSSLLGENEICDDPEDFTIEVRSRDGAKLSIGCRKVACWV